MGVKFKKCEICGGDFCYTTGYFTLHLEKEHNITLKDYVVKFEYGGVVPKCKCGFCDDDAPFVRGKFTKIYMEHKKFSFFKEEYIKKYGIPKCTCCGGNVETWHRDVPNKYCSMECFSKDKTGEKRDNEPLRLALQEKYGVDNVMELKWVREKYDISVSELHNNLEKMEQINNKRINTVKEKYGVDSIMKLDWVKEKLKSSFMIKYGVDNYNKTEKGRKESSQRMIDNNPMKNPEVAKKQSITFINRLLNGEYDFYNIENFKDTNLTYQSSYEYEFLEICEELGIINDISDGCVYSYNPEYSHLGHCLITDYTYKNYEIEIKSTWIKEKQGGDEKINAKKDSVISTGMKYVLILDKNYDDFLQIVDQHDDFLLKNMNITF